MAITKAEVKRIVLGALEYYKELMDAANTKKFPTRMEMQTELDAIDVPDLSEVETKLDSLETGVEELKVLQNNAAVEIAELKENVADLKDDPNTEVEDITYAEVAELFNE